MTRCAAPWIVSRRYCSTSASFVSGIVPCGTHRVSRADRSVIICQFWAFRRVRRLRRLRRRRAACYATAALESANERPQCSCRSVTPRTRRARPSSRTRSIAANVAVFLLLNVPLGSRRADVNDPAFREYVEVMSRELQGRVDVRQLVAQTSAYDLFAFEHGYRPARPAGRGPAELHVPARRLHAPLREHAVPLDLRRQRRAPARRDPLPPLVPGHRRRRRRSPTRSSSPPPTCRSSAPRAPSPASSASTSSGSRATPCGCSPSCRRS